MSYSPNLGRWLTEDPIGFAGRDPNLYRYEGNQPTGYVDPSGLQKALGGEKYDLPETIHPSRFFLNPDSKDKCLKDVPFRRMKDLPQLPKGVKPEILSGGRGWEGVIPDGVYVGPDGCGPCVGLVLVPPKRHMPTYVLHFTAKQHIEKSLKTVGFIYLFEDSAAVWVIRDGYRAIITGAEQGSDKEGDAERLHTLEDVTKWLREHKVPIGAYVPAPGFAVDSSGQVYWITPPGIPVDKYEK